MTITKREVEERIWSAHRVAALWPDDGIRRQTCATDIPRGYTVEDYNKGEVHIPDALWDAILKYGKRPPRPTPAEWDQAEEVIFEWLRGLGRRDRTLLELRSLQMYATRSRKNGGFEWIADEMRKRDRSWRGGASTWRGRYHRAVQDAQRIANGKAETHPQREVA